MVFNQLIECNICKALIRLRTQIGYFDIPFHFSCPVCDVPISGKVKIDNENISIDYEVENAELVNSGEEASESYIIELSAEFPTKKEANLDIGDIEPTPFFRSAQFFNDFSKTLDFTGIASSFSKFINNDWPKMKTFYEMLWNGKSSLVFSQIQAEVEKYDCIAIRRINDELSVVMALHQILLTVSNISAVLSPGALEDYVNVSKMIIDQSSILNIITFLDSQSIDIDSIERKAFKVIDAFAKIYDLIIPVISTAERRKS